MLRRLENPRDGYVDRLLYRRLSRLLTRALQCGRVGIAERDDFRFRTQRKARKMILKRDAAATNDGDTDLFHDNKVSREYGEASGKDKRCQSDARPKQPTPLGVSWVCFI